MEYIRMDLIWVIFLCVDISVGNRRDEGGGGCNGQTKILLSCWKRATGSFCYIRLDQQNAAGKN